MLTGRRPFNPPTPYQIMEELRAGVRVRPTELRADLPAEAEDAIMRALSYDEGDRQPRARDFCEKLARALARPAAVAAQTQVVSNDGPVVAPTLPAQGVTLHPAATRSPTLG